MGEALFELMVHFLLLHRTHELRLIPDSSFEEVPFDQVMFMESSSQVLARAIDPAPGEGAEQQVARALAMRLSSPKGGGL